MKDYVNILIIENEPLTMHTLKQALLHVKKFSENQYNNIIVAKDYQQAIIEIKKATTSNPIDLVIQNINIPSNQNNQSIEAEDVVKTLRHQFSEVKLMLFCSKCDNYRISNALESMNPDSFLIKSEIDFDELVIAIKKVLIEPPYYSQKILRLMRRRLSNNLMLDKIDILILHYLSKGVKTKDLSNHIRLSTAGIERRKRNLKALFNIDKGGDYLLLERARNKGFI